MNDDQLLAKFDLEQFQWKCLHTDDGAEARIRLLAGGECAHDIMNRYVQGDQTLFFAVYVDLEYAFARAKIIETCRNAWKWLRYHVPIIACTISVRDDNYSYLEYHSPTPSGADEWVGRTFVVHDQQVLDLNELRTQVGQTRIPSSAGDQTWLHFVTHASAADDTITRVGFLFQSHHAPFDGPGIKLVSSHYLTQVARSLDSSTSYDIAWGNEVHNLSPCVYNILSAVEPRPIPPHSAEQPSFDHPYYQSMQTIYSGVFKASQLSHEGRIPMGSGDVPETSAGLSVRCLASNPLSHAALAMVVMSDNPPHKNDLESFLNNYSLVNCRSRLMEPYSQPTHEGYPGYAIGMTMMRIPVSMFCSSSGELLPLNRNLLFKAMATIRELYNHQRAVPAPLSCMAQLGQIMSASMKDAAVSDLLPPNQCYMLSSDGVGERYLQPTYADHSGKTVLTVPKFFSSLNRNDPGPFFRISSWKGVIELSADFNSNILSKDEVRHHLTKWKKLMLLITRDAQDEITISGTTGRLDYK
ncbi:uncharacterized protein BT62DRAFT_918842 [Guyanagaster necrorhizus]|uniref:Uncharacterized protein n=1 Tax=Guyanagaster necrorhizus TaxID=856835 RepID=A0A9P8ATT8_9AGAR|nr:uncharacterized protein BT62DRAFT_918842 [Guyanagaster necrorhizus MCA 3950]KAG7447560.1 hypothetical protein BT62DRAFT_918842 [Guyanagaster necrorhizus MCA 3950]